MIEFLLFCSICAILYLVFGRQESEPSNDLEESLRQENEFLRIKLNERVSSVEEREKNLNRTIQQLQSTISKQQSITSTSNSEFKKKESELIQKKQELEKKLDEETIARKKVLSQKKSGEVRLGHIAETLAPFLDQFDFEPEKCSFLGQPIDYISFGDDEITFIEVKSGNSQLSQKQRHIRDLVKAKLVSWKEVRIK
jgi:predicted Holliday junction resolvase-like endonuclease